MCCSYLLSHIRHLFCFLLPLFSRSHSLCLLSLSLSSLIHSEKLWNSVCPAAEADFEVFKAFYQYMAFKNHNYHKLPVAVTDTHGICLQYWLTYAHTPTHMIVVTSSNEQLPTILHATPYISHHIIPPRHASHTTSHLLAHHALHYAPYTTPNTRTFRYEHILHKHTHRSPETISQYR